MFSLADFLPPTLHHRCVGPACLRTGLLSCHVIGQACHACMSAKRPPYQAATPCSIQPPVFGGWHAFHPSSQNLSAGVKLGRTQYWNAQAVFHWPALLGINKEELTHDCRLITVVILRTLLWLVGTARHLADHVVIVSIML